MNKVISNILTGVVIASGLGFWSCSNENPFDNDDLGTIKLHTVVNNIVTRADEENSDQSLRDSCVVYISNPNSEKLVKKWKGLDNVDKQITLKAGFYVAEAWTGDSVTASWDKKFYRGYQTFEVTKGSTSNIVLNCRIANVVASINASTINQDLMKDDYSLTIKNTRGECVFTKDVIDKKAYFMMPNGDNKLLYEIKGTKSDGKPFSQNGEINVERAHHYIFNLQYNPESSDNQTGYVFIKINIKDEEIIDENVHVFTKPSISGIDFDIEKKLKFINDEDIPEEGISVKICGNRLNDVILQPADGCKWDEILGLDETNKNLISDEINFAKLSVDNPIMSLCKEKGLEYKAQYNEDTKIETAYFNFSKGLFLRLTQSEELHKLEIRVTDSHNQESTALLLTARTETAAIDDPIEIKQVASDDWQSIRANSVYLTFNLASTYEGTPGVEYSKANEDKWTFVAAPIPAGRPGMAYTRADEDYKIHITGLEEGTTYKYRARCGNFRSEDIFTFTTESKFIIPYADMEVWNAFNIAKQDGCTLPGTGADEFWGNGNPGSMKMGVSLTQGSEEIKRSGSKSAKLRSQFVGLGGLAGKFAAGNLFAGSYLETQGTDGRLSFGRPYNGSHPVALKVWVNYRPAVADKNGSKNGHLATGELDEGQIFVALSTEPVEVRTKTSNQKLFDKDEAIILAYGEHTFNKVNYGPDGSLQELIIPIEYYERSTNTKATQLIIVCSASKYGDFFDGGEGSTMYLDDFELIYE